MDNILLDNFSDCVSDLLQEQIRMYKFYLKLDDDKNIKKYRTRIKSLLNLLLLEVNNI